MTNATTVELEGDRCLVVTRTFDGPARLVYDAWTRPELIMRWWAPKSRGVTMVSCDCDVRVGGGYRYVFRARGGEPMAFLGTYREVVPNARLVHTEIFEPAGAEAGSLITVTFTERDGKTSVVSRSVFPSKAVLDMVLATGMEEGMLESLDQLDALVASL